MPSDSGRYPGPDESVHLFLLTSELEDGALDLVPEVFVRVDADPYLWYWSSVLA